MGFLEVYTKKQKFNPDLIGLFINPFFFARRGLFKGMSNYSKDLSGDILDVGCGNKPYKELFRYDKYIGMDIENSGHDHKNEDIDVFYDGTIFPFDDRVFDGVLANQVLEHVFNPDEFLQQINRVLKVKGHLLLTVPFIWDEHEQPYDYGRYSSLGLRFLLEKNGFKIISHSKSVNDLRVVFQLLILYIYKAIRTKNKFINLILTIIFIGPINILGSVISFMLPRNNDLFLDNIIFAEKR